MPPDDAAPEHPEGCAVWPADLQWGTALDDRAGVTITQTGDVLVYGYEGGRLHVENVEPAGLPRGFVERIAGRRPAWRWDLRWPEGGVVDALHQRSDGTLQVSGRVREPASPEARAQYQLALGEMTTDGVLLDLHHLGDRPSEHPRHIASSGGWNVVAGYEDIYIPSNYVADVEDPFIVTWRDGELKNATLARFATSWTDYVHGVAIDPDGHVTVAGTSRGGDMLGAFVRRYDESGRILATEWISQGPLESLAAVERLPDGDFLVAGSTWKPLGSPAFGGEDVFVARFDATFSSRRWLRKVGTSSSEMVVDMTVTPDGRSWIVGETLGSFDEAPNRGESDVFVAALAADGAVRWITQHGSATDDQPTRIAVDACESVLVAGTTNGSLVPGFEPSGYDAFVLRAR